MHKKLAATLTIAIFLIGTLAIIVPTQATFTEGNLTGTTPYDTINFDPHYPGVIGYVWPGSGECAYLGLPNSVNDNCAPGYQSAYPQGNPPGAPSNSWYQLEGNAYAPFGAVLTGSTGDLIFAINATACNAWGAQPNSLTTCTGGKLLPGQTSLPTGRFTGTWDYIGIYLPPGFTVPDASQVVTSFTNDYANTIVARASPYDRFGPNDTVVYIVADAGQDAGSTNVASACTPAQPTPAPITCGTYYQHQRIQFTNLGEWYYIRINGVTAPTTAGKYFFKIFMGNSASGTLGGEEGVNNPCSNTTPECDAGMSQLQFIPTQNWPVMLVKGEVDPAIITGTIRYAGYNATLYGAPVQEAGKVWAEMTMRVDPYTGLQRPDLPTINAVGYFNATATGHYEVEGLAPGIYDLYASAMGYPQTLCASGVTVLRGQSLHFDCYLQPGPVIHGNVFTKHQFGDEPWPAKQYIKIELYANPTLSNIPDPSAGPSVSWTPFPCVAGGQQAFYPKRDAGYCGDPRNGGAVAAPWHEYTPANGYGYPTPFTGESFYQVAAGTGKLQNPNNIMTQDPMGVGPPQQWYVEGGTTNPFHFEMGVKGEYGAPTTLDGGVPQVYATWVNGLTPGRYYARAWTFRYVQTALDGATFQEYYFDITPNEWAGDVTLPIDLRLSSWVNKTVHFHDTAGTIVDQPIDTGAGEMSGILQDASGNVWSYNQTLLGYYGYYSHGVESGFNWNDASYPGAYDTTTQRHKNNLDPEGINANSIATGVATIQFWGWNDTWGGENYGIPSGTYTPHVFALGYIENSPVEQVSVTLSGTPTDISDHVYRGAGFNLTIYSIDWERPTVPRNWVYGQWGIGPFSVDKIADATLQKAGVVRSGQLPFTWGEGYTTDGIAEAGVGCTANQNTPGHIIVTNQCGPLSSNGNLSPSWGTMVGQEISVGIYNNGSLNNWIGDEESLLADTVPTSCLFQNDTTSFVSSCGGGWNPVGVNLFGTPYSAASTQGFNANGAFFGQELKRLGFVGGYTSGTFYTLLAKKFFGPASTGCLTPVPGSVNALYCEGASNLYPSAMPANLQYDFRAYTYGYIQDQAFTAWAASGQVADVRLNLVIGVNVTLDVLFKKESIITPTAMNMSARVRLFDDTGNLVAEWMSSEGVYTPATGFATAADGETQFPFNAVGDPYQPNPVTVSGITTPNGAVPYPVPLNGYNYLPGGVTKLHVQMAGLPQVPPSGQNDAPDNTFLPKGTYFMDPILSPGCDFELDCYANPGNAPGTVPAYAPGYFPNSGILGGSDYTGGWTAEVDFVPWYANNTVTPEAASGYAGCPNYECQAWTNPVPPFHPVWAQYYPPVVGLLDGESFHIIPGTTATSGISLTEDLATGVGAGTGWPGAGWSVGHTMAANLLGPYSQEGVWQISNAHNSGEASAVFEVDLNGFVSGSVVGFTYAGDFRTVSWGYVTVVGATGATLGVGPTVDGLYGMYLPAGNYKLTFTVPGYAPQTMAYSVTSGQTGTGANVYLQQNQIPVPEFSTVAVVAFSALAASLYLLRRRRK